jgi:uncharacterized membrane protein YtjA (UPF0391 family)
MLRWWSLSVVTAVGAVLFGFDGISAGPRTIAHIALVGSLALGIAVIASLFGRWTEAQR